jgi:hypothetical protein
VESLRHVRGFFYFSFLFFTAALAPAAVFASQTNGTITAGQGYAWSEHLGWINFGTAQGNVHVTDAALTGYAWGQNAGWINLAPTNSGVDNNSEGDLSKFAWGATVGWIDFQHVAIGTGGVFSGYAYNAATGRILFDCANCNVRTDWRPASIRSGTPPPPPPAALPARPLDIRPTIIHFSGTAYPGARIVIVERSAEFGDRPVGQARVESASGSFYISFTDFGLFHYGKYGYSAVIYDPDGRVSQVKTYPIDIISQSVVARNILATPTVALTRALITKGDAAKVIGYASPKKNVTIDIDQRLQYQTLSGADGKYMILISTAELAFGPHSVRAKQTDPATKVESDFSPIRQFIVSPHTVVQADLNNDGRIDVKDWSIFLARWQNRGGATDASIDLNADGKNDVSDLAIFLRAFRSQ